MLQSFDNIKIILSYWKAYEKYSKSNDKSNLR